MENSMYPRMDRESRAKQFMAFDALKGFQEALKEKEREIVPKKELSEEKKAELDGKLRQIHKRDIITAEYFWEGEYRQVTGEVAGIDTVYKVLKIAGMGIRLDDISDLHGEGLES